MKKKTQKNNHYLLKNLLAMVVGVFFLLLLSVILLDLYTRQGKEIEVPDFTSMSVAEAEELAARAGLTVSVVDSVYLKQVRRGVVFSQMPKAAAKVKQGRNVMLTINANSIRKVSVPSLVGFSVRQARAELASRNLVLRRIEYTPDMATNNVLGQKYRGETVAPGTMLAAGSGIDLVAGLNPDDCETCVPSLKGCKYQTAVDFIHDNSLNVGRVYFDSTVKTYADSVAAFVYSYSPSSSEEMVAMGSDVAISLTLDQNRISDK